MDIQDYAVHIEKSNKEGKYLDTVSLLTSLDIACVTVKHLQETDIVRVLYRVLKNCPQLPVKMKVKHLLSKWKKLYSHSEHRKRGEKSTVDEKKVASLLFNRVEQGDSQTGPQPNSTLVKGTKAIREEKTPLRTDRPSTSDCLATNSNHQEATLTTCNESLVLRPKCVQLLLGSLNPEGSAGLETTAATASLAEDIEQHIYNLHRANPAKYKTCVRSKVANLRNPKNGHLREGLLSGSLAPEAFSRMSMQEMASVELQRLREEYSSQGVSERQLPRGLEGTPTQKIRCRRCDGSDCKVTQVSRGTLFLPAWVHSGNPGEDAMTFVTCSGCGEQWYHSGWVCL
ncbi:transcription elongation factor A N-terminal and central domain-containing protein isoform X1 [Hypomesus transpacificus]|uniref:transcription elongation factor A N-terminal and central domain-containing protein isoform X1 n=2 Tax=Hypomesus transpacificus TaxID=137520 RepID=UPI001F07D4DD|nr:transcription elongation factor A N-terminal and central domain-containing protein isoform X1 [Hypomesus transpacificus]